MRLVCVPYDAWRVAVNSLTIDYKLPAGVRVSEFDLQIGENW